MIEARLDCKADSTGYGPAMACDTPRSRRRLTFHFRRRHHADIRRHRGTRVVDESRMVETGTLDRIATVDEI